MSDETQHHPAWPAPPQFDGALDLVKPENFPANLDHQQRWELEIMGYLPMAEDPTPPEVKVRHPILRKIGHWLNSAFAELGRPYDIYADHPF